MRLSVAGIQLGPFKGSYEEQLSNIERLATEARRARKVDIICLPELMTTPYFARTGDTRWRDAAEPVPGGETFQRISRLAQDLGCFILATCCELRRDKHYNSAFFVAPDGRLIGTYAKTHIPLIHSLATDEKAFFDPGPELPVFTIKDVPVGVLICYDRSFPEAWRTLALKGAELVFVPSSSSGFRGDLYVQELTVAAAHNQFFVVGVNKAGTEFVAGEPDPKTFYGKSCIIDPFGNKIAYLDREEDTYLWAELDLAAVAAARETLRYYEDRRTDLYVRE